MANKDLVFVVLDLVEEGGMNVLEWIFNHFEIGETSLVLTCFNTGDKYKSKFIHDFENEYLPRCITEKFEAKLLILEAKWPSPRAECFLELIAKHGMTKLITCTDRIRDALDFFAMNPGLSCRMWVIERRARVLVCIRDTRKMETTERLPNEDGLTEQIIEQRPLKENKVFIALSRQTLTGEKVLDWVFQNFQNEKPKLIVTNTGLHPERPLKGLIVGLPETGEQFILEAKGYHLPRCQKEGFEAEIVVPREKRLTDIILELMTKHGMERLVVSASHIKNLLESLGSMSNIACMIWVIHERTGKLVHYRDAREIRLLLKENDLHQQKKERHHLTKEYEELIIEKPQSKENLEEISQKLQAKNNFLQEEQNLKIALRKVEDERDMLPEQNNAREILDLKERLASLQIDHIKLQTERDNTLKEAEKLHKERNRSDFTLQELEHATQNFSDSLILGKGAYGCVYKGYLRGTIVAVKRLNSQCAEGTKAFKREVDILTSVRHPNLVTLMGACYEVSALVYEFLPNGSLEDHLNHKNGTSLTWQVRTSIMAEICLALIFLHSSKPNMVIHGDLKPDNVLLDANFVSKLGDFGISRLIEQTGMSVVYKTYNPVGTPGYMDPEFIYNLELTEKSDVFAFGVIVLRLITGKPVKRNITNVREAMKNKTLHEIIDETAGKWPFDQAEELIMLGLRCAEIEASRRPNLYNDVWPIIERLRHH